MSPSVSHLLFADDSLFFCKADTQQSKELIEIIRSHGVASCEEINFYKSSIMFGADVLTTTRHEIKEIIGKHLEGEMGTYLGLPKKIHGSKVQVLVFVRDRLHRRVNTRRKNSFPKEKKRF